MKILTAPYSALTRISFYREVSELRLTQALKYLAFLAVITTAIMFFVFVRVLVPVMDETMEWVQAEMPILTATSEGLIMDQPSPYTMVHPDAGPVVMFDTERVDVTEEEMAGVFVFITSQRVYVRQAPGEIRIYDVQDYMGNYFRDNPGAAAYITPESVRNFYAGIKPWLMVLFVIVYLPFFFLWKLFAAVFYSWFGLLINMGRNQKLTYTAILNVSIFALTAGVVLLWIRLVAPVFNEIPFIEPLGMAVTFVYLYLGIRKTDDPERLEPEAVTA